MRPPNAPLDSDIAATVAVSVLAPGRLHVVTAEDPHALADDQHCPLHEYGMPLGQHTWLGHTSGALGSEHGFESNTEQPLTATTPKIALVALPTSHLFETFFPTGRSLFLEQDVTVAHLLRADEKSARARRRGFEKIDENVMVVRKLSKPLARNA